MANEKTLYRAMSGDTYTDVEVLAQEAEDKAVAKSRVTWRIPGGVGGSMKYGADRATVEALFDGEVSTTPTPETTPEPAKKYAKLTLEVVGEPVEYTPDGYIVSFTNYDLTENNTIYAGGKDMVIELPEIKEGEYVYLPLADEDYYDIQDEHEQLKHLAVKVYKGLEDDSNLQSDWTAEARLNENVGRISDESGIFLNDVKEDDIIRVIVTIPQASEANLETKK